MELTACYMYLAQSTVSIPGPSAPNNNKCQTSLISLIVAIVFICTGVLQEFYLATVTCPMELTVCCLAQSTVHLLGHFTPGPSVPNNNERQRSLISLTVTIVFICPGVLQEFYHSTVAGPMELTACYLAQNTVHLHLPYLPQVTTNVSADQTQKMTVCWCDRMAYQLQVSQSSLWHLIRPTMFGPRLLTYPVM